MRVGVFCRRIDFGLGIWVPRRLFRPSPGVRQDEVICHVSSSQFAEHRFWIRWWIFQPFKSRRETELFYSTFEQKKFAIAVTPIPTKISKRVNGLHDFTSFIKSNNSRHDIRVCIGSGVQALQRRGIAEVLVDPCNDAEAAAEGAYLAAFIYDELKSTSRQTVKPHISCYTDHLDVSGADTKNKESILAAWRRGTELAMAQNLARKWMEMPANLLSPMAFATQISSVLEGISNGLVRTKIRNADWCREQRMNGLLSVGAGSHRSVVFLEIVYEVSGCIWADTFSAYVELLLPACFMSDFQSTLPTIMKCYQSSMLLDFQCAGVQYDSSL
ncbi:cytosol aminopeptidase [Paragonimus westermani]|uniref:Cytosol aminopeptidase n=1 Tax=Paragonimus westermani TaxID=34504 RepID=A0A5J4N8A2_9TREM|nr:cytosol aminopeptidase [Paragonimus westermani]